MIGSLEAEILLVLKALKRAPARTVRTELDRRGTTLAYTTVATSLARLHAKGMLRRRLEPCQGGMRFVYESADFEHKYLRNLLRGVVTLFGPAGVVHLNEELAKLKPAEERELRRRLRL
ncbi:MAG: BlaI/MecI/CopY family transcriptional regulator [Thermoplasmata archaeon]|nr:BlaI/MecI/CopY family transcriptional regulator [Thermoplasmata archaeon]